MCTFLPCATAVLPCTWTRRAMCTGMLCYLARVVLYVPVNCGIHCIVPGFRHAYCLPCATAVLPCAWTCRTVCSGVLCYTLLFCRVLRLCCATHCMVHGVHGYVCHLYEAPVLYVRFAVSYGYATCVWTCRTVYRYVVVPIA